MHSSGMKIHCVLQSNGDHPENAIANVARKERTPAPKHGSVSC